MLAQLGQGLGLNLTDALARHGKLLPNFLQRVALAILQAKAHFDNLLLAITQGGENVLHLLLEKLVGGRFFGADRIFILDKVPEHRLLRVVAIAPHTSVEAADVLLDLHHIFDLIRLHIELFGKLGNGWLAVQVLGEAALGAQQLVNRLHHMDRNTNSARLVGNRTGNRLANPPGGIGAKLKALVWVKLLHCPQQPSVPFLNKIEKIEATTTVPLGNAYHQAHISLGHFVFGALIALFNPVG